MNGGGIRSFSHWRFGAVIALHLLACLLLLETGTTGPVQLPVGLLAFAIAFIIVATVAWQWRSLGDPWKPHHLVTHLTLLAAVFFLIVRLHSPVTPSPTVFSAIASAAKWSAGVVGLFPPGIFEALASPATALFFVLTCFALSLQRQVAVGLFVVLAVAAVAIASRQPDFGNMTTFLGGIACVGVALALQFSHAAERNFWDKVHARVDEERALRGDLELKHRILQRMLREGRPVSEQECAATVERALGAVEPAEIEAATVRVVRQMVRADGLAHIEDGSRGRVLVLNPDLYRLPVDGFSMLAVVPRSLCVFAIAFLWIISPIDIVPDTLPVVGVLDDAVVTILGGSVLSNLLDWARARKRSRPGQGGGHALDEV